MLRLSPTVFAFLLGLAAQAQADPNVRILSVDPSTDVVTLKNFGDMDQDISSWRLCSLLTYTGIDALGSLIPMGGGDTNLSAGEEVTVDLSLAGSGLQSLIDLDADVGLYTQSPFSQAANMVDFTQYGASGNGRESVAVTKGIWTAGTFVAHPGPFTYTGDGSQNGASAWSNSAPPAPPPEVPLAPTAWLVPAGLLALGTLSAARMRRQTA